MVSMCSALDLQMAGTGALRMKHTRTGDSVVGFNWFQEKGWGLQRSHQEDEGSAEEAGHGDEQILESSTKRAHEVVHVLQQAATYENIPALRTSLRWQGLCLGRSCKTKGT